MKPSPTVRLLLIFPLLLLWSCTARIDQPTPRPLAAAASITWPSWEPISLNKDRTRKNAHFFPKDTPAAGGYVTSFGSDNSGSEEFFVISKRSEQIPETIFPLNMQFFPTSLLAGKSPYGKDFNTLKTDKRHWFLTAFPYRSTHFETFPATTREPKGMIHYQTSIMMLSIVEKRLIKRFQNHGWHVLVGLPSDSFYRSRLPAYRDLKGDPITAVDFLAEQMDRHYAEQAYSTRVAMDYLRKTRPDWLAKKRVLIGTSAGSFATPAVALQTPSWDSIVLVSAGTNLLDAYERDAAGVFKGGMDWVEWVRAQNPKDIARIPTEEEYRALYREASKLTTLHSGRLAPHIANERILYIHGTVDKIIPKDQLAALYPALNYPERWTYPLGHHLVALQLLKDVPKLDAWLMKSGRTTK
ncbi:MAG: hypothetical protein ABF377_01575 [Akkermansiaceae bacterium]